MNNTSYAALSDVLSSTHNSNDVLKKPLQILVPYSDSESETEHMLPTVPDTGIGHFSIIKDLSYVNPASFHEPSLIAPVPLNVTVQEGPMSVSWEIVQGASKRGRKVLFNNLGYRYNFLKNSKNNDTAYWVCSKKECKARVTQRGSTFVTSSAVHSCEPEIGAVLVGKIRSTSNTEAIKQPFISAMTLVKQAIRSHVPSGVACHLPPPQILARNANRQREKGRPQHPKDLGFKLNDLAVPVDFMKHDVTIQGNRHLIFGTNHQYNLLVRAENWFVDGTFKVYRQSLFKININKYLFNKYLIKLLLILLISRKYIHLLYFFRSHGVRLLKCSPSMHLYDQVHV